MSAQPKHAARRVEDIMSRKVEVAHFHESVATARDRMRAESVDTVAVVDGDRFVGILTEREIADRERAGGFDPQDVAVRDIVSPSVLYCSADHTLEQAAAIMEGGHMTRLPVLDKEKALVGIVALEDLADRAGRDDLTRAVAEEINPKPDPAGESGHPEVFSQKPQLKP